MRIVRSHGLTKYVAFAKALVGKRVSNAWRGHGHSYGEPRFVTFGLLGGEVVVLVYTERDDDFHVISLRRAEKYEARYYFEATKESR